MDRDGVTQEISSLPFNSEPQMAIEIGSGEEISVRRIPIGTEVEYLSESEWVAGIVLTYNSIQVGEEVVELGANTSIRLKAKPQVVGLLIYDLELSDIAYNADDMQELIRTIYGSGFVKDYLFGTVQATGGLQITVSSGHAIIDGIVTFFKVPQKLNVEAGSTTVRKDLLVLRKVQAEKNGYLAIKRGVEKPTNPQPPALTQVVNGVYEIGIAEITVQPNAVSISQQEIKDVRPIIPSANYPVIAPYYVQYPDTNGNFNANEEPSVWFKKMYNVTTTWQIMFNDKSVFFRTEGTKSSVSRSNGLQPYGIKNISGSVICQDHPVISKAGGICSSDYLYPKMGVSMATAKKDFYQGFNFRTDRQIKSYSDDLVVDNYQIRIYKLLTINGKKISDVIGR